MWEFLASLGISSFTLKRSRLKKEWDMWSRTNPEQIRAWNQNQATHRTTQFIQPYIIWLETGLQFCVCENKVVVITYWVERGGGVGSCLLHIIISVVNNWYIHSSLGFSYLLWKWKWSHVRLFETLWTIAYQAPLSMGFSRQRHWSGLPFPSPGDLPNSGIEPGSPALQADALLSEIPVKPLPSVSNYNFKLLH